MSKPKVLVATPLYGGSVKRLFHTSMVAMLKDLWRAGIETDEKTLDNIGIAEKRDAFAAYLLRGDASHVLMVDSDTAFPPDECRRLLGFKKEVIGAMYPMRVLDWQAMAAAAGRGGSFEEIAMAGHRFAVAERHVLGREGELLRLSGIGMGFTLIAREAFERVVRAGTVATYPSLRWPGGMVHAFFREIVAPDGNAFGEDLSFCRRVRDAGGEIWGDPVPEMGHVGDLTYSASYDRWARAQA